MTANAVVRARIDQTVKTEATEVLAGIGLTVSDAVRILLTKIAREKTLPLDLTPNALTAETLRKSHRGEDVHFGPGSEALFRDLDI